MAQLIGENRVGASVSFRNGRPEKKEYRRYTVKGEAIDDLRMMSEVVERWLKRQDEWPDLLLLDGGETHLNTIYQMLKENKVDEQFELAAIAKREETLFRLDMDPIILDRNGRVNPNSIQVIEISGGDENAQKVAFRRAKIAIISCGKNGYKLPPNKYERWREIEVVFDPTN